MNANAGGPILNLRILVTEEHETMKYLMWLLKAAIFFTLFAFALNNQQDATVHFFFGTSGAAPMVLVVLAAFAAGWSSACWAWCPAGGAAAARRAQANRWRPPRPASDARPHRLPRCHPMEFDLSWMLLGLPLAFVLGWLASRFDLRQLRIENRQAPKAYFKGLNFLLNEQQDQAIDAFIEAVQNDPDTSELHFALGNLFRRRGEYERAVRVHEHLLSRGDLSQADRHRAQHALALDYLKAGLLDRAEEALRKLEGTPFEGRSPPGPAGQLRALARLGPRQPRWPSAWRPQARAFQHPLAHYLCEQARHLAAMTRQAAATAAAGMADACPTRPRPRIDWPAAAHQRGHAAGPLHALLRAGRSARRCPAPDRRRMLAQPRRPADARRRCWRAAVALRQRPPRWMCWRHRGPGACTWAHARPRPGTCATWSESHRWWLPPNGLPAKSSSTSSSTRRCSARWTMPSSR
jgi:tetratricopeptide (TPR) repeat protein